METDIVDAVYGKPIMEEYEGNPFIEALPPVCNTEEVIVKLADYPDFNAAERELDARSRAYRLRRLLRYFQPLPMHLGVEEQVGMAIREGYLSRNPVKADFNRKLNEGASAIRSGSEEYFRQNKTVSTAIGFTIIGISGIGKTATLNRILSLYPQVIRHTQYRDRSLYLMQLTWLKIDCPFDGSIKGLCITFFAKVDAILGTEYAKNFSARMTVDAALPRMAQIALVHGLGLLVIDEIQHLSEAKSGGSSRMLNFFVMLVNSVGIPVVLIGTGKAVSVLQSAFRQARRGSGQRDFLWDRLEKDKVWDMFVKSLWKNQWTRNVVPLTEELNNALYEESQGIVDMAIKIYVLAQTKAISSKEERITVKLIKSVVGESLKLVKPMLDALKTGDKRKLSLYDDIQSLNMDELIASQLGTLYIDDYISAPLSAEEDAVTNLIKMGIAASKAQKAVKKVLKSAKGSQSMEVILQKAFKFAMGMEDNISASDKKNKESLSEHGIDQDDIVGDVSNDN